MLTNTIPSGLCLYFMLQNFSNFLLSKNSNVFGNDVVVDYVDLPLCFVSFHLLKYY
jgi:hypothetical protein